MFLRSVAYYFIPVWKFPIFTIPYKCSSISSYIDSWAYLEFEYFEKSNYHTFIVFYYNYSFLIQLAVNAALNQQIQPPSGSSIELSICIFFNLLYVVLRFLSYFLLYFHHDLVLSHYFHSKQRPKNLYALEPNLICKDRFVGDFPPVNKFYIRSYTSEMMKLKNAIFGTSCTIRQKTNLWW